MSKFKGGDVVRLKSGGPQMTVLEYQNDVFLIAQWFLVTEEMRSHQFHESQLEMTEIVNPSFEQL